MKVFWACPSLSPHSYPDRNFAKKWSYSAIFSTTSRRSSLKPINDLSNAMFGTYYYHECHNGVNGGRTGGPGWPSRRCIRADTAARRARTPASKPEHTCHPGGGCGHMWVDADTCGWMRTHVAPGVDVDTCHPGGGCGHMSPRGWMCTHAAPRVDVVRSFRGYSCA